MNSSSLSRHNNSTHVPKQLPLQPLSKNSQDSTPSTRTYRDKNSSKSSKLSEPQSFSSKHKTLRHRNSKENMPDSRMTSISVISKIPDEKEDPFFVPPHKVKNGKKDHHTEKSFQDLNKSLANLALGRCIGRSSSDNDAIGHLNRTESDFQRSYGPSNTCMDANQTYHSSSKTPLSSKRSVRNMQTSAQKGMEVTPFSFVNQITRESVKAQEGQFKRETSSKDLMLSNLEYARVQNSACGKSARLNHNMHYLPIDTKVRRNLVTEGNYQMEFSNIENLDNTDTQMFSYYYSNDVQLSYLNGEINIEHEGDDEELESVTERKVKQEGSISNEPLQKNVPHFGSQQNYRSTPSFKRTKCYNSNTSSKNNNGNPRRYSDLASVPRTTVKNMGMSMRNLRERSGRYELNHISDDVEYMMGGVGINQELRKKQKPNSRNKSSFVETEASSKRERAESVRGETLVVWKQDLMKIKKEMESRKKSYAEVNKFVKMHGNGTSVARVKDSRESSFDPYATRKTSNISLANLSVLEKMDTLKPYSSGLKGLVTQEISEDRRRLSGLKTVGDYSDKRSATTPLEEQINAMSKYRVKTGPYYDFNNETNDFNHSFRYEENVIFEKTQRQPCCGPEKMCNIF